MLRRTGQSLEIIEDGKGEKCGEKCNVGRNAGGFVTDGGKNIVDNGR